MASEDKLSVHGTAVWEGAERQQLRRRDRQMQRARPGLRPDPLRAPGTDRLPQIKHIVVLMMENHSFDNYLGTLNRGEGLPLGADGLPDAENPDASGHVVRAYHMPSTEQHSGVPCQSWRAAHAQFAGGKMTGFATATDDASVAADKSIAMGYWTQIDLPFYHGLASTFPLADHWFSSCLGPTFPNRRFLLAGTAHGLMDDLPINLFDYPPAGTILDLLTKYGKSWVNYRPDAGDQSQFRHFLRYRRLRSQHHLHALGRPFQRVRSGVKRDLQFTAGLYPLGMARYMLHIRGIDEFFADADAGTLPDFCIVDPDYNEYSEENPQDIRKGESFSSEVVRRVMHGKAWPETLLIWTYDEGGGYYDHVAPPAAEPPDDVPGRSLIAHPSWLRSVIKPVFPGYVRHAQNLVCEPNRYDTYGFRVPAVIVSPYARPDCVLAEVFDHTSVLKLVEEKWNLPALTCRDAAARAPLAALDFDSQPAFLKPPTLPAPSLAWGSW
ncbi:MAG TPA: alkaline phosphatase family protein [Streptosporangiaceae bacterium]|nr:alkaline phosphatase family protein [Streptosporangiaceae bacterium]